MLHHHFDFCDSTHIYLKNNFGELTRKNSQKEEGILISTSSQKKGTGRLGSHWIHFLNNLALSFTIPPNSEITLTSLELSILVSNFFQLETQLKWPNDLINSQNQKCGGILCQFLNSKTIIASVGLNLFIEPNEEISFSDFKFTPGSLLSSFKKNQSFQKDISLDLYQYIKENRLSSHQVLTKWNDLCFHMNKKVRIENESSSKKGIFKGIGKKGEAILEDQGKINKLFSGSLFILEN